MPMIQIRTSGMTKDDYTDLLNAFDIATTAHVQSYCNDITAYGKLECRACEGKTVCDMLMNVIPYLEEKYKTYLFNEMEGEIK